jgi:hypothetical protein
MAPARDNSLPLPVPSQQNCSPAICLDSSLYRTYRDLAGEIAAQLCGLCEGIVRERDGTPEIYCWRGIDRSNLLVSRAGCAGTIRPVGDEWRLMKAFGEVPQKSMAMNWPPLLKPRACRSASGECPCFYPLFDLRFLCVLANLLIDVRSPFGPISHIAEQHQENFSRVSCCHCFSPSGEFVRLGLKYDYALAKGATSCQKC